MSIPRRSTMSVSAREPELTPEVTGPRTTILTLPVPAPAAVLITDPGLSLIALGRWSRFLTASLDHVRLTELSERNSAVAQHFSFTE